MKNLLIFIALVTLFSSCKDDEIIQKNGTLFNDSRVIIDYEVNNNFVEIFVDGIGDTEDLTPLGFDEWGLVEVRSDFNTNFRLDGNLDRMYAKAPEVINPDNRSLCRVLLIETNITSGCEVPETGSYEFNFSATENSDIPHSNYLLRIPIDDISDSNSANLIIRYTNGRTINFYPSADLSFEEVYQISW